MSAHSTTWMRNCEPFTVSHENNGMLSDPSWICFNYIFFVGDWLDGPNQAELHDILSPLSHVWTTGKTSRLHTHAASAKIGDSCAPAKHFSYVRPMTGLVVATMLTPRPAPDVELHLFVCHSRVPACE